MNNVLKRNMIERIQANTIKDKRKTRIKKSMLITSNKQSMVHLKHVLQGKSRSSRQDVLNEVRRYLIELKLTPEEILKRYKSILERQDVKFKGSDVVKVLENLSVLAGMTPQKNDEENKIDDFVRLYGSKSEDELMESLRAIEERAARYRKKLEERQKRTPIG